MPMTRLHYDHAQRMDLKALGMELWCKAVLEAYKTEKVALATLPDASPSRDRNGVWPSDSRANFRREDSGW